MVSPLAAAARACWIVVYGQPLGQTFSVAACAGAVPRPIRLPATSTAITNQALVIATTSGGSQRAQNYSTRPLGSAIARLLRCSARSGEDCRLRGICAG